jgi:signal transduction histidine kinase
MGYSNLCTGKLRARSSGCFHFLSIIRRFLSLVSATKTASNFARFVSLALGGHVLESLDERRTKIAIGKVQLQCVFPRRQVRIASASEMGAIVRGKIGALLHLIELLIRDGNIKALLNILHNAIRYSPAGSAIKIGCYRDLGSVLIAVADKGPGISAGHREQIFERFFQVDKVRSRTEGSTGLGLAIAKMSIERQGGRIELESELGRGSTFRIVLSRTTGKSSETLN